jgi:hypothetical protein
MFERANEHIGAFGRLWAPAWTSTPRRPTHGTLQSTAAQAPVSHIRPSHPEHDGRHVHGEYALSFSEYAMVFAHLTV